MVAASLKIRASAGSPGRAWRPARRRCGAARRERPPAAVAVRRRWQVLRRRYRPRRGRTGRYRSRRRAACAAAAARRRGSSRSDRWAWSCVAVWRRRSSGPCRGCVQPNICRTSCPGPHCSNPLRIRRWGRSATSRQGAPAYAWALTEGGARGGSSPAAGPIGLPRIRLRRSARSAPERRRRLGDILPSAQDFAIMPRPISATISVSALTHNLATVRRHLDQTAAAAQACRRPSGPSSRPMPTATASNRRWRGSPRRRGWRCWTWTRRCAAARPAGAVRSCCWRVSSNPPTWTSSTAIT